ncbi:hypothetical protein TSMEX_001904 [Taenia solium]|eukprot:TsM_001245500 transcript=TsM_001245500 gene=TsM_001245500
MLMSCNASVVPASMTDRPCLSHVFAMDGRIGSTWSWLDQTNFAGDKSLLKREEKENGRSAERTDLIYCQYKAESKLPIVATNKSLQQDDTTM